MSSIDDKLNTIGNLPPVEVDPDNYAHRVIAVGWLGVP